MPSQDAKHAQEPGSSGSPGPAGRRLSRRSLLQGAATAGAAGLAVTAVGAAVSPAQAAASQPSAPERPPGHGHVPAGPIMVHVRDARAGDIEVFSGTSQTRVRDKDLAARIARTIG
jgi:hypothetical protein